MNTTLIIGTEGSGKEHLFANQVLKSLSKGKRTMVFTNSPGIVFKYLTAIKPNKEFLGLNLTISSVSDMIDALNLISDKREEYDEFFINCIGFTSENVTLLMGFALGLKINLVVGMEEALEDNPEKVIKVIKNKDGKLEKLLFDQATMSDIVFRANRMLANSY